MIVPSCLGTHDPSDDSDSGVSDSSCLGTYDPRLRLQSERLLRLL